MGWTFSQREKGITQKEWFTRDFEGNGYKVLDVAGGSIDRNNVYMALKHPKGYVFALCFLTRWRRNDYYNFGYKDMGEGMGPNISDCPKRIFDLLSPLEDIYSPDSSSLEWATNWRERVKKHHERMSKRVRLSDGLRVCVPYDLNFNYFTIKANAQFVVENAKRKIFSHNGSRFRLRKDTLLDLQIGA